MALLESTGGPRVVVRPLAGSDRPEWDVLWRGYLDFYEHPLPAEISDATFTRLVERRESMWGLVAEVDGVPVGLAHVLEHASTWTLDGYVYLEDLFVDPAARANGAATALIESVVAAAAGRKVYWQTREDNPARRLYDRLARWDGYVVYECPPD